MNEQQKTNLDDLLNQINDRLAIIGETPDAYFMLQLIEILKFEISKNSKQTSIEAMVDRFLCWKLPKDFAPDCGVTFKPLNHPTSWPTGTNLFTGEQARAMLLHLQEG